jgi:hypothetical protein
MLATSPAAARLLSSVTGAASASEARAKNEAKKRMVDVARCARDQLGVEL